MFGIFQNRTFLTGIYVAGGLILALLFIYVLLDWYIDPMSPDDRVALTQAFFAMFSGLISGVIVGGGGLLLSWRNLRQSDENTRETLHSTQAIEEERTQADTLQSYFEIMARLLSDPDTRDSNRALARAQSLATLEVLNPQRKRILLQFLYESNLLTIGDAYIELSRANLTAADLRDINLVGANIAGVNLIGADLTDADLTDADLTDAMVTNDQLAKCRSLKDAKMPDGSKHP